MTNENDSDIPRHAEHEPGAEVKVSPTEEGGVTVEFSDGSEDLEVSRREFMRISGVAAASAAMAGANCRYPKERVVPYLDRPDEIETGQKTHYSTVCNGCSAQCGLVAETRSGRPIKLEGNDDHPVNEGGICARGESSYRRLYDPDRARGPLKVSKDGAHSELDWQSLDDDLVNRLKELRGTGGVRILTRGDSGSARDGLIETITDEVPDAEHYTWEPLSSEALAQAGEASFGSRQVPTYHFERADMIVSLGSDFLGTWMSPPEFTKKFTEHRDPGEEMSRFVAYEGAMTLTGSNADDHQTVRTSHLVYIALGLANAVLLEENYGPLSGNGQVRSAVEQFTPEKVAEKTGVDADKLRAHAGELVDHAGDSIVIAGGPASNATNGVSLEAAVNLLNVALGNEGNTIDRSRPSHQETGSFSELQTLAEEMKNGEVALLIVDGANPVYAAPPELEFEKGLDKVNMVVSTSDRVDETARFADFLAAGSHYLESWGDSNPAAGVHAIQQPTIQPLYDTRTFEESLLVWFGQSGLVEGFKSYLQAPDAPNDPQVGKHVPYDPGAWYRYLRAHWKSEIFERAQAAVSFDQFWEEVLRRGVLEIDDPQADEPRFETAATVEMLPDSLPEKAASTDGGDLGDMELHAFPTVGLYDGRTANNGHLQEMPDPVTKHTWGSYALLSPRTFVKADLEQGEVLTIEANGRKKSFPVIMQPGMHDDVVAVPLGYGRDHTGTVGDDIGENAFEFTRVSDGVHAQAGISAAVESTGVVEDVAVVQGSQVIDLDERPLFGVATAEGYKEFADNAGPDTHSPFGAHTPEEALWDAHDYGRQEEGGQNRGEFNLQWGMSIDMSLCTGCSACVTACQEENNVPVVGKQGILEGREMHWMRIDRYFVLPSSGVDEAWDDLRHDIDEDPMLGQDPVVDFAREFPDKMADLQASTQPMLCQHCERAPCETVCPVSATTHSSDGLNQMAYNRCVGTRYCSNNCPYKVRRFNWYNYSNDRSEGIFARITPELEEHSRLNVEEPLPLGMNPDVTVRSRGVMEKCTFCVQRIRRAKWQLREEGRDEFREDDVTTACEKACPADAIKFGNLLDETHEVHQDHRSLRAAHALSHINVAPSVAYLADIRNTEHLPGGQKIETHGGHGGGHGEEHGSEKHGSQKHGGDKNDEKSKEHH